MELTTDTLRAMRAEIDTALLNVGAKFGVRLKAGSATFDPLQATFKLGVTQATAEGKQAILDEAREQWEDQARIYGMKADWFGREFYMSGSRYRVAGLAPSRSKNVVKITRLPDGKGFVTSPDTVIRKLSVPGAL
jgi:hypothetical protein